MRTIATIGVYQSSLDDFLDTLRRHRVAMVVDVRQRRGVRGREYAWANSLRLQAALAQAGIPYRHVPKLAPVMERDSCRAVPAAWPVQRSMRLVMSFSTLAAGMPP